MADDTREGILTELASAESVREVLLADMKFSVVDGQQQGS